MRRLALDLGVPEPGVERAGTVVLDADVQRDLSEASLARLLLTALDELRADSAASPRVVDAEVLELGGVRGERARPLDQNVTDRLVLDPRPQIHLLTATLTLEALTMAAGHAAHGALDGGKLVLFEWPDLGGP